MGQESLRRLQGQRKGKASPPILSQEFIIQNHGDIMSCIVMLVFAGFMFTATTPVASLFVSPQYNFTNGSGEVYERTLFRSGVKDIFSVVFYTVCAIVTHAVIQEYFLDKLQRRLHLSKTKTSKFTESGHLFIFSAYSIGHAAYILHYESYVPAFSTLWIDYPTAHAAMPLSLKLYFLVQLAWWLHQFPEFYFQKCKKEEIRARSVYTLIYLFSIGAAYALNFTRVSICLLTLHFFAEFVFHGCRMAHFAEKTSVSESGFKLFNVVFVKARLGSVALAVYTFWHGFSHKDTEAAVINVEEGNFNTSFIRLNCLLGVCGLQAWMMFNFLTFHLKRNRSTSKAGNKAAVRNKTRSPKDKTQQRKMDEDTADLPEADQETSRVLRSGGHKKRD